MVTAETVAEAFLRLRSEYLRPWLERCELTSNTVNVFENKETVVDLLNSPRNDPDAPALTERPVLTSVHPESWDPDVLDKERSSSANVSRSRLTVASAKPLRASMPKRT